MTVAPKLFVAIVLLASQENAMAADVTPEMIEGSAWILAELPPDDLLNGVTVTLAFEDDQVVGTDGCNRFRGPYEITTDGLDIGNLAATMMACPDPVMVQARKFTAALGRARKARVEDGELLLVDATGKAVARFSAQPRSLAATSWDVTSYNNGKSAVVGTTSGTSMSMAFDDAEGISGSGGCNRFTGSYSTSGNSVTITLGAVTATELQRRRNGTGKAVPGITRQGHQHSEWKAIRLELRDGGGALQVIARRSD